MLSGDYIGNQYFPQVSPSGRVTVCMVGVSVFVYAKINKGELFLVDKKTTVSLKMFDTFKLEQTISYFSDKKKRFESLQEKGISTFDPYIPKPEAKK